VKPHDIRPRERREFHQNAFACDRLEPTIPELRTEVDRIVQVLEADRGLGCGVIVVEMGNHFVRECTDLPRQVFEPVRVCTGLAGNLGSQHVGMVGNLIEQTTERDGALGGYPATTQSSDGSSTCATATGGSGFPPPREEPRPNATVEPDGGVSLA
jgi:hypothetical protein